jgi:hypothetical protein
MQLLHDFKDVNAGEKLLMEAWNTHIRNDIPPHKLFDCQMQNICESFIKTHAVFLKRQQLRNNFVLHLTLLNEFKLISAQGVRQVIQILDSQMAMVS